MRNHPRAIALLLAVPLLASCASAPVLSLPRPPTDAQGRIIVFRESSFIAGSVSLAVGVNSQAFALVSNSEKVSAVLPVGRHEVFVQARSAEPTRVRVNVASGSTVCLRTIARSSTLVRVLVPITLMASGYEFLLEEVKCPSTDQLTRFKDVVVTYQ